MRLSLALALLAVAASAPTALAQPDWDTRPTLAPAPTFVPPAVERHTLSNGLPVLFVEKPGVPLAQVNLLVRVGSADDGDRDGLARLAGDMMDEGAGDLDALGLADAIDFLGIGLSTGAGLHSLQVRLHTPLSKLDPALDLMTAVALQPTFPEADLDRVRTSRITALEQRRDEARSIASVALAQALYGADHPYGRTGDGSPATIAALSRADLVDFHERWVQPDNAALVVVGAVAWEDIAGQIERAFGSERWPARTDAMPPRPALDDPIQVGPRAVILVDKPGAAQSVVRIGRIGVERATPDYHRLEVLNTIFGGSFTSRLNQNLRERNGYSYGAGSAFDYRPVAGPFVAYADVQTDVTAPALTEFFREFEAIAEPITDVELSKARDYLTLSFPSPFATVSGTAAMVGEMWLSDLADDAYARYGERVQQVTAADLEQAATDVLNPNRVVVLIVGDREVIEADVRALNLGPLQLLTVDDVLGPTH